MDYPKEFTHVSLCAGYGGIDLGLKRAIPTLRTVAFSEIEAYACANLVAKMEAGQLDAAPIWTDLKTFPWSEFRDRVEILSGGYPCQPFSAAGKRLGTADPRHLWPFIADGIRDMRPQLCFFENVEGHISLGLRAVLSELESIGYTATWGIFSAAEVGAPHQRKRVFILAHRRDKGLEGYAKHELLRHKPGRNTAGPHGSSADAGLLGACWPSRPGQPQHGWEPPRVVGNATQRQNDGRESGDMGIAASQGRCGDDAADGASEDVAHTECPQRGPDSVPAIAGQRQEDSDWLTERGGHMARPVRSEQAGRIATGGETEVRWSHDQSGGSTAHIRQAQPPLGGDADGPPGGMDYGKLCIASDNRTDELRLLGNGVVPATAHKAFVTLYNELFLS